MSDKQLKNKAVPIKGKKYVLVADRVIYFNDTYPKGSIRTEYTLDGDTYHVKASVVPDADTPDRYFNGHSQATIGDGMVNKTAALENCETSAVGRALGFMGIGVIEAIASIDEINKAQGSEGKRASNPRFATMKQIELMVNKVKWGLKIYDKEEIVGWLDSVIGKDLTAITADEVDGFLVKIDEALREEKIADKIAKNVDEPVQTDEDQPISLEDIPY